MKAKTIYVLCPFLMVFFTFAAASGQSLQKGDLFKLSDDYCLTFTAIQKDAPLRFEGIEAYIGKRGGVPTLNWVLVNRTAKTIRRFQVAFKIRTNVAKLDGTGGDIEYDVGINEAVDLILPNGIYTEFKYPKYTLPVEMLDWFKPDSRGGARRLVLVYGMVTKVVFADGTTYEDSNEAFKEF
jgi:hypothetical protein